jgi:transposase
MLKAQKVRLYPNKVQQEIISSQIGGARYVYNRALALRKFAYSKFGIKVGKFALINHITKLKKREETSWLKEIDSQAIANMCKDFLHKLLKQYSENRTVVVEYQEIVMALALLCSGLKLSILNKYNIAQLLIVFSCR